MTTFVAIPPDPQIKIFNYSGCPTSHAQVCKNLALDVAKGLRENLRFLSPELRTRALVISEDVQKTEANIPLQTFRVFRHLYMELSEKLIELDPEMHISIRQIFQGSLSCSRFSRMESEIFALNYFPSMWRALVKIDDSFVTHANAMEIRKTFRAMEEIAQEPICNSIQKIKFVGLGLKELPQALRIFPNLTDVQLSHNAFTSLSFLDALPNLRILKFMNNPIPKERMELEAERVADHPSLEAFIGDEDFSKIVGPKLDYSKALRRLWVEVIPMNNLSYFTQASKIMSAFLDANNQPFLGNVRRLVLSHCGLRVLPKEIAQVRNLQDLDLYGNLLTDLPDHFSSLKKLRSLILEENPLDVKKQDRFRKMFADMPLLVAVHFSAFSLKNDEEKVQAPPIPPNTRTSMCVIL